MSNNGWNVQVKKGRTVCGKAGCLGSCPTQVVVKGYSPGGTIATCRVCSARFPKPGKGAGKDKGKSSNEKVLEEEVKSLRKQLKNQNSAAQASPAAGAPPPSTPTSKPSELEKQAEEKCKAARAALQQLENMSLEIGRSFFSDFDAALEKARSEVKAREAEKRDLKPTNEQLKQCRSRLKNLGNRLEKQEGVVKDTTEAIQALQVKLLAQQAAEATIRKEIDDAQVELDKISAQAEAEVISSDSTGDSDSALPLSEDMLDSLLSGRITNSTIAAIQVMRDKGLLAPSKTGTSDEPPDSQATGSVYADLAAEDDDADYDMDEGIVYIDYTHDQLRNLVGQGFNEGENLDNASKEELKVLNRKANVWQAHKVLKPGVKKVNKKAKY